MAFGKWYYAALANFKTQMAPGYKYPDDSTKISDLLAPGYLIAAVGLEDKPGKDFGLFIAPLTVKLTLALNKELADAGAFGVSKSVKDDSTGAIVIAGRSARMELGGYLRMFFTRNLMKNVTIQTKLDLFSNL